MKVAVYDNPYTMRREAWIDGSMEGFISFSLLSQKGFNIRNAAGKIPWIIDDAPFSPGRIRGDKDAIDIIY